MEMRDLGRQGLRVASIGLGTMGMTMAYGPGDDEESVATIHRAHELGVTFFDTAELYGQGTGSNEKLLGQAVRPYRDEVVLATKFGFDLTGTRPHRVDSRPEHILEVAENSLRYLDTDRIDVLYQHRPDPDVPIEEVAGAVKQLVDQGKVLYFGLSEAGPDTIRRAHAVLPVSVLQTEYSIFERDVEEKILPTVRELGVGFVPYSPLGRGFLTDATKPADQYPEGDMRRRDNRWAGENYDLNMKALGELKALAEAKGATLPQLAIAWLLHQGDDIVPIPGTKSRVRLEENVGAAEVEFDAADLARITAIFPDGSFGRRYPDGAITDW
ncbi:MAG TPA: aldo/keto reductase [Acidimicrobiales bacterium]|jgi:aryl-alcohol dehydrogenase-like predicted oxidoreductase